MPNAVVTLDMRDFDNVDKRDAFVRTLGQGFEEIGFVTLIGHGVDERITAPAYDALRRFFALPTEKKLTYHVPGGGGARGYTPFRVETAKDAAEPDLKEFWHVGREVPPGVACPKELTPNLWPSEIEGFEPALLALYRALDSLGNRVLEAIALHLGLPQSYFADKVDLGNSILRPLHYPPLAAGVEGGVRSAAHEDINLITLLVGSGEPGLEVLTRDGKWLPIETSNGVVVCNIGDMLQRLTNHVLKSTTHRVINPPSPWSETSRYSVPFFLHPNSDFLIQTLPRCVSDDHPDRYPEPITADAYLQQRLREIGLI